MLDEEMFAHDAQNPGDEDEFQRRPFAARIAKGLCASIDPRSIVVGIYGSWGSGKSTVLDYVEEELGKLDAVPVRFNPWYSGDELALINSFFGTLLSTIGSSQISTKEKIGKALQRYGPIVGALAKGASSLTGGIDFLSDSVGNTAKAIGETLAQTSPEEGKKKVEEALREARKRIVVLVDDIDRLDKAEIHAIFKLVKLTAGFPYVSFVLAFDDKVVARALAEKYGPESDAGEGFLEKIVQVPLHLPLPHGEDLSTFCLLHVNRGLKASGIELTKKQAAEFNGDFRTYLAARIATPRAAKRYANAVAFIGHMLKGEVNLVDVMLLEGLKVFYSPLYQFTRSNPSVVTDSIELQRVGQERNEQEKKMVRAAIEQCPTESQADGEALLFRLFPNCPGLRNDRLHNSNLGSWHLEQRVAARQYFNRYLACSIPSDEARDADIRSFLESIESNPPAAADRFKALVRDELRVVSTIEKLRIGIGTLGPQALSSLAEIVAADGTVFQDDLRSFFTDRPSYKAARLIREILLRLPESDRLTVALRILSRSQPVSFSVTCYNGMRERTSRMAFTASDEISLAETVVDRIEKACETGSALELFSGVPLHVALDEWSRRSSADRVKTHIRSGLSKRPCTVLTLLEGGSWPDEESWYTSLCQIAFPEDIIEAIQACSPKPEAGDRFIELHRRRTEDSPPLPAAGAGA